MLKKLIKPSNLGDCIIRIHESISNVGEFDNRMFRINLFNNLVHVSVEKNVSVRWIFIITGV